MSSKNASPSSSGSSFDPNAASTEDSGVFGLPYTIEEAKLVYLPVTWEATTSYGGGTSEGPAAIFEASKQVDLYDFHVLRPYEAKLAWKDADPEIGAWNEKAKALAQKVIEKGGRIEGDAALERALSEVNALSEKVNARVRESTAKIFQADQIPALVGGDHSTPFGAFQACADAVGEFGILHLDAHSDTRDAFEGFQHSHASIMNNALSSIPGIRKLVQVGIRDFCEEEVEFCRQQGDRVKIFFDAALQRSKQEGKSWLSLCDEMIADLPKNVWVSFDIDGLDPRFCPHTGTPVPGGLDFSEAVAIFEALARSGRKIVGFDLNEVAPGEDEWDANVGARMLYKLTAFTLVSQGLAAWNRELR